VQILPVFITATVATNALAVVMLARPRHDQGCAAARRLVCPPHHYPGRGDGRQLPAGLSAAFAGRRRRRSVREGEPPVQNISAVARIGSIGMLASLPPVVFAAVLFVRSRRFPASG
jgi:hypothetical protein